jgi:hypothetical protein
MASERQRGVLLAALAVVLGGIVVYQVWPSPAATRASSSNGSARARRDQRGGVQPTAPDVHMEALSEERPRPEEADRDLFKFKPKAPPPAAARPAAPRPEASRPAPPPGPPGPPPITLKFIGYIDGPGGKKIASLSDGVHVPVSAVEGQTVLGQYKIWRIGVESLDISYLDGRGRQTIRMTGQ